MRGGPLPARAFESGDRVIGEDEGGLHGGVVSEHNGPRQVSNEQVLVYWDEEDYTSSSHGHLVQADALRLWPFHAHEKREKELSVNFPAPSNWAGGEEEKTP